MTAIEIETSHGPARADLAVPGGDGSPSFLLVLTHGAGGSASAPDLLAARDAALQAGGATALVTQPYRVRGARAPGSADRQDQAWREIIAFLRRSPWFTPGEAPSAGEGLLRAGEMPLASGEVPSPARDVPPAAEKVPSAGAEASSAAADVPSGTGLPLIVGGRSNGARVACRTASAVGARGVIALAFPLHPPGRRVDAARAGTSHPPTREAELRAAAEGGVRVLVVNGDKDPFGIPVPGDAVQVVVLKGETHSLSRHPAAVTDVITGWLTGVVPLVR